jgi:hypothetical protein
MRATHSIMESECRTHSPERNRYFYGKLLDVYHFELETRYHNVKRWLINRAVLGYGVVCGLDVQCGKDDYSLVITPGIAIDKCGKEIVVPCPVEVRIPEEIIRRIKKSSGYKQETKESHDEDYRDKKECVQVMLCYHECLADPLPVLAGDCHNTDPCAPGTIREKFRIEFTEECEHPEHDSCQIPQIVSGGQIDYAALTKWVSRDRNCFEVPENPCIRLAHVYLEEEGHCHRDDNIDITVRPIVYSNDLLFEILLGWRRESREKYVK